MQTEQIQNACKDQITKYCGIFKTLGDRRLQTNLFQGLHRLIGYAIRHNAATCTSAENLSQLTEMFSSKGRFNEKNELMQTPKLKIHRSHAPGQLHKDYITQNRIYTDEENARLNDFSSIFLAQQSAGQQVVFHKLAESLQSLELPNLKQNMTGEEQQLLAENLQVLKQSTDSDTLAKAIPLIFSRCGAEAGKTKRLLDEHEISWGYFTDHNPFEPHCNAHPNNLVVLDPTKNQHANLLGVLDLDLAYGFKAFINTIEPDPEMFTDADNLQIQRGKYGSNNREQFDDWVNSEKYELEVALGGEEVF